MFGRKGHSVNLVFVILLLGIFAIAAVFVAVLGAKIYESGAQKMQDNFDTRTSIIYLSEKIRTAGNTEPISTRNLTGAGDALVIPETIGDKNYEAWIFVANGQLCETTVAAGDTPLPDAAQRIMPLTSFKVTEENGGVSLTVVTAPGSGGKSRTVTTFLAKRTGL